MVQDERRIVRMCLAILIATVFVASGVYAFFAVHPSVQRRTSDMGGELTSVAPAASDSTLSSADGFTLSSPQSSSSISVTIALKSNGSLSDYLSYIENPSSPLYRHFLTPQEIGSIYGVPQSVYDMIEGYFSSFGLQVMPSSTRLVLTLTGTPSQLDAALHTRIAQLSSNTTSAYVNTMPEYLPEQVAMHVLGIAGLDGIFAVPSLSQLNLSLASMLNTSGQTAINASQALYYASGNYTWSPFSPPYGDYQFLWPGTMPAVTGAHNLWYGRTTISSEPDMGQGITIAVTEVGLISPQTISEFSAQVFHNPNQLPDRFTQIGVDIPNLTAGIQDAREWGWTGETALDIEYIAAMAPEAHIVLVGVPNDLLEGFDVGYQAISQYLVNGQPLISNPYVKIISGPAQGATSISITSNSHSFEAIDTEYFASPFDVLVQEQLVNILAIQGVTQFFASGDFGSNNGGTVLQTSRPVEVPGVVGVGGGQLTVNSNSIEFPDTGIYTTISGMAMEVARATGISTFTYWAFNQGGGGTYGSSTTIPQPWWENALDTYSTGGEIIPVVSNAAAFNMTLFNAGRWFEFYGGTSFATPITAGEWALIEEQAMVAYGTPFMGSANALLFEAHNAHEAGATPLNPFVPMVNIGVGWDWAPFNSYDWNFLNTSQEYPQDLNLPEWYPSIFNPAGPGWNFLQGLGLPVADTLDMVLVGQVPADQHSLLAEPFFVLLNTSNGLQPFQSLTGGQSYNFTVVYSNGQVADDVTVLAYSGGPNNGTYGGGTYTEIATRNGSFTYIPSYAAWPVPTNASEYGFFYVRSDGGSGVSALWSFQQFAVDQPTLSGNLSLELMTPYGFENGSTVEVTMFQDFNVQDTYNFGTLGVVMLNGRPLMGATIVQTAVSINYESIDPTVSPSQYASGMTIGSWLSDFRGQFYLWNNPLVAANSGPVPTQIYTVRAYYDNISSNQITVFVEPQAGAFIPAVSINQIAGSLQGTVVFSGMKYLNFINISIGAGAGQFVNETFPANTTYNGAVEINFTELPPAGTPVVLTMVAEGENTISLPFSFFVYSYGSQSFGDPITWYFAIDINNPGGDPVSSLSVASTLLSGTVPVSYSGSWNAAGAYGVLTVSSASGIQSLLRTTQLSGTFEWNTTGLPDGFYMLTYAVYTPTGLSSSSHAVVYLDNQAVRLNSEVSELRNELASAEESISNLTHELQADSATIAQLQQQTAQLSSELSNLSIQLANAEEAYNVTASRLQSALSVNDSYRIEVGALLSQLAAENATISAYTMQITSMQLQLQELRSQLDASRQGAFALMGEGLFPVLVLIAGAAALAISLARPWVMRMRPSKGKERKDVNSRKHRR